MKERWEVRSPQGDVWAECGSRVDAAEARGEGESIVHVVTRVVRRTWTRNGWRLVATLVAGEWTWREKDGATHGGFMASPRSLAEAEAEANEWAAQKRGPRCAGRIVKSADENTWSGPGVGDPDNAAIGHEVVRSRSKAHAFTDRRDAEEEAATYGCGARVLRVRGKR